MEWIRSAAAALRRWAAGQRSGLILDRNLALVDALRAVAEAKRVTVAQAAIA